MMLAVSSQRSAVRNLRKVFFFCLLLTAYYSLGCSIPNLEPTECVEARDVAKQFYSFHLGNDMTPSLANLKLRERYLTPEYYSNLVRLQNAGIDADHDPFSPFSERGFPRTFKIGKCQNFGENVVDLQVQFYWRDDYSTDQRELHADIVKANGVWLIRHVGTGIVP